MSRTCAPASDKIVSRYDATFAVADPVSRIAIGARRRSAARRRRARLRRRLRRLCARRARLQDRDDLQPARLRHRRQMGLGPWAGCRRASPTTCATCWRSRPRSGCIIAHGYSDMVTPYAVSRYVLDHLPQIGEGDARAAETLSRRPHVLYRCAVAQGLHAPTCGRCTHTLTTANDRRPHRAPHGGRRPRRVHSHPQDRHPRRLWPSKELLRARTSGTDSASSAGCWGRSTITNISNCWKGCATITTISIRRSIRTRGFSAAAITRPTTICSTSFVRSAQGREFHRGAPRGDRATRTAGAQSAGRGQGAAR